MASTTRRLMPQQSLTANQVQPRDEVMDAGAYKTLECQGRCIVAGSNGQAKIQHAAVNEPDAFKDLAGAAWNLNATNNTVVSISNFLRYLRWVTDANVAGNPVALIDVVAKD